MSVIFGLQGRNSYLLPQRTGGSALLGFFREKLRCPISDWGHGTNWSLITCVLQLDPHTVCLIRQHRLYCLLFAQCPSAIRHQRYRWICYQKVHVCQNIPQHARLKTKSAVFLYEEQTQGEVSAWAEHKTFSLCPPEDISCLQLHSRIPFPASFCSVNSGPTPLWVSGTQGGQWVSFRFAVVKKAHCRWGPPPTSTLILHGCAFSHWLNQWQGDKRTSPPLFFTLSLGLFGGSLKVQNSVRESDLWHHLFWFCISLSKMMSGLWQRSVECVTPRVEWCQNRPGKMINTTFLCFSGQRVRSSCYLSFAERILAIAAKLKVLPLSRWISISVSDKLTLL